MGIYSKRVTGLGYTVYTLDKRPIKTANVPSNITDLLEVQAEVDDTQLDKLEKPYKKCVFCGVGSKMFRIVNGQTVDICEEHYHSTTLGQVAQQTRLNEEAKNG